MHKAIAYHPAAGVSKQMIEHNASGRMGVMVCLMMVWVMLGMKVKGTTI
jgi:hypothetical protein